MQWSEKGPVGAQGGSAEEGLMILARIIGRRMLKERMAASKEAQPVKIESNSFAGRA